MVALVLPDAFDSAEDCRLQILDRHVIPDTPPSPSSQVQLRFDDSARAAPGPDPQPGEDPQGLVLYIEDNAVNMLIVEQFLARWPKLRLEQADLGELGLEKIRRLRPDVTLLDMQLPDLSGLQLLARLQADPALCSLRVVALSASAMAEDIRVARQAGAFDYWTKPLDLEQFGRDLRALLPHPGE